MGCAGGRTFFWGGVGKKWINRDLSADEINALAQAPLGAEYFDWYAVSTRVNNTRNDGADLVTKI